MNAMNAMNAKRIKQLVKQEYPKVLKQILDERKSKADAAKRRLDENRTDVHYVLDQASKGKAEREV